MSDILSVLRMMPDSSGFCKIYELQINGCCQSHKPRGKSQACERHSALDVSPGSYLTLDCSHMIRLFPYPICKAETVEYLETSALQSIRLTIEDLSTSFVDHSSVDSTTRCPGCGHQTRWACTDNQEVIFRILNQNHFECYGQRR